MVGLGRQVLLFLTLFVPHVHGDISARLSSESIEELESVRLVIRAHNTRRAESLDLTDLEEEEDKKSKSENEKDENMIEFYFKL